MVDPNAQARLRVSNSHLSDSPTNLLDADAPASNGLVEVSDSRFARAKCAGNIGGGTWTGNAFESSFKYALVVFYPGRLKLFRNTFSQTVRFNTADRANADVRDNAFLAGVWNESGDQDHRDLSQNWWGHVVDPDPRQCYASYPIHPELQGYTIDASCPNPNRYKRATGRYFTKVTPALAAFPPGAPQPPLLGGPLTGAEVLGGSNPSERCAQAIRCHADPVDTSSGNFFETFQDLAVAGRGIPLSFRRTYNAAQAAVDGPLGFGWTHSYDMALDLSGTRTTIRQENASEVAFVASGTAWVPASPRVLASLVRKSDGTWTFIRRKREIISFDATGRLLSVADRNGATTTLAYPDPDTVVVRDQAGRTMTLAHEDGRLRRVTDPMGRVVAFAYDGAGDLVEVTDVGGGRATFSYDGAHRMVTKRSPRFADDTTTSPAPEVTNIYDPVGRVVSQRDQIGRTTTFDYTTVAGSVIVTDPKGNATLDTYEQGVLVAQTKGYASADAARWQFRYDPRTVGVVSVTDPAGRTSTFGYDTAGNRTTSTDALGRTTTATFNTFDQPLTVTDADRVTTTATYDPAGNPTSISTPQLGDEGQVLATRTTTYRHDDPAQPGDVTSLIDPRGKTWTFAYSANGDLRSTTAPPTPESPPGNTTTFEHNAVGWTTAVVSPRGNRPGADADDYRSTVDHDDFGRPLVVRSPLWDPATPDANQRRRDYDADGNVIATVDGETNATTYDYDPAGQLLAERRADGTTLSHGYWPDGSLAERTDGAGATTSYAYDAQGRPTTTTDPIGRVSTTTYDTTGNPATAEDPGGDCGATPRRGCTTYGHDEANQLASIDYSDPATPDVTDIDYDANGRRIAMVDGTGTSIWDWDSLGRLVASTDGAGATVGYGYDLGDNVTSIGYPDAGTLTRTYDDSGRLESVGDWLSNTTTFAYDADSNLVSQAYPNATTATAGFDSAGRLEDIAHAAASTPADPFSAFAYTRDGNDGLASVSSTGPEPGAQDYGYDQLQRLVGVDDAALAYDGADNLTQLADGTFQDFDAANQLCYAVSGITPEAASNGDCATPPAGATTFAYDARGNRTSASSPTGAVGTYTYDQANRLIASTSPGAGGTTYAYGGDGLRSGKTTPESVTAFTWDRSGALPMLLAETSGAATTRYVYGPGGTPLARIDASGQTIYYHLDQLGSTRALSDIDGEVVATASYDPYGKPSASTGIDQPFGFAGQYTDAETGFQYLRARYYDPATGQFLTRDPLEATTGQPYAYANNSPLNYTDPSGEIAWFAVAAVAWAVFEVGSAAVDAVSTAQTFADPCASGWDKAVSGGLFAAGAALPGGGYSTGARAVKGRGITGYTRHGLNQAISRDGVGVAPSAILDAVRNPLQTIPRNGTVRHVGERAVVVLNDAGRVITTWARSSAGRRL